MSAVIVVDVAHSRIGMRRVAAHVAGVHALEPALVDLVAGMTVEELLQADAHLEPRRARRRGRRGCRARTRGDASARRDRCRTRRRGPRPARRGSRNRAAAAPCRPRAASGRASRPARVSVRAIDLRRTLEAEDLLDRIRDPAGIGDHLRPFVREPLQGEQAVAEQLRRRLVPGDDQQEEEADDLLVGEVIAFAVGRDQRGREIVGAGIATAGRRRTRRSTCRAGTRRRCRRA